MPAYQMISIQSLLKDIQQDQATPIGELGATGKGEMLQMSIWREFVKVNAGRYLAVFQSAYIEKAVAAVRP